MSDLLEQKNENFKAIVAEVNGEIVGFICINRETNQAHLRETYDLELFDYLVKGKKLNIIKKVYKIQTWKH